LPGQRWEQLLEIATAQYGFVTTRDATDLGLPRSYLGKMKARGSIERVAHGLYRFPQVPVSENAHFMEAVLWVGEHAVLSHDAVLSLHGLAGANPHVIRVSTPRRIRKSDPPAAIKVIRRTIPDGDQTRYEGIPSTTVARALLDSRNLIMRSRLLESAHQARADGLVPRRTFVQLLEKLEATHG
jgi:predicted transcriptional regulator of viral defense system